MSNFDFLKNYDEELYKAGINIENNVNTSPAAVLSYATPFLERVLELLMAEIGQKFNRRKEFYYQLDAVHRAGKIKYGFKQTIYGAYQLRNRIHTNIDEMQRSEFFIAQQLHQKLFYIAKKLYEDFFPDKDLYNEVPSFKPIEITSANDEVELIKIPDFSQVIDIDYDYCIICGEPNHLSSSLCCHKCNRVLDNADNYISIRNYLGKDKQFTKNDLIDYGIPEGYVNQFVNSMVRENMLHAKGRYYTFNNMHLDDFLRKIDNYIAVCELITKFREDKISPAIIKTTREYKLGSLKQDPFHQFYIITNREIVKKFERDILTTENILNSIAYTTITQKQLNRWYDLQLADYKKGNVNRSFVVYNRLLIEDYLELKRLGMTESDIKEQLNVTAKVYDFWHQFDKYFESKLKQIKIDLLTEAIQSGKTRDEVLVYAGVTAKEYNDLVKVSNHKKDDFSKMRNQEIESRKKQFVKYLLNFDLRVSCKKARIPLEDFYEYYDTADVNSPFYVKSTEILMDKFLLQRSRFKTEKEAMEIVGIKQKYLDRWIKRSTYKNFCDRYLQVKVDLILKGFKRNLPLVEIAKISGVSVKTINSYIHLGERDYEIYKPLFDYYERKTIPNKINKFLKVVKTKPIRKAIEASKLSEDEVNKYYELGKSGDERYREFYEEFFKAKRATYLFNISKGKSHKIAMRESWFSQSEYEENKDDLSQSLVHIQQIIIMEAFKDKKTSNIACKKANITVDEMYDWYFKGRDGEEDYIDFYEVVHGLYVRPNINSIQKSLDNNRSHLDNLIRSNKSEFTKKDIEIWVKHGLLDNKVLMLNKHNDDEDAKDKKGKSKFNANEMLREMGVEDYDKISLRKTSNSSSILSNNDQDVEKIKRQILK